jgi:uncharacterized protein (DUF3084 family)
MLKNIWNYIKTFFLQFFEFNNLMSELEELRLRREHLFTNYMDLDRRTAAARCIKQEIEQLDIRIQELEQIIYE